MWQHITQQWREPLDVLTSQLLAGRGDLVLLYSGLQTHYSGCYSYLALDKREEVKGSDWAGLASQLSADRPWYDNAWFGWLGYGLKHGVETLPDDVADAACSPVAHWPDMWMARFGLILRFDHEAKQIDLFFEDAAAQAQLADGAVAVQALPSFAVQDVASPMSRSEYMAQLEGLLEAIRAGTLYQANLTRKFTGTYHDEGALQAVGLFQRLCAVSPAPYSAFIKSGDRYVLSSSPEQFLTIDSDGVVESRPIKGTRPRGSDEKRDAALKQALEASVKDRAENLMIVDLMRNDLSRSCDIDSVQVDELFAVHSYATVHHMASRVSGRKRVDVPTIEVVRQSFPPGSMTGAPKIRAIEWCSQAERLKRGVYSGAIGWFGGDGSVDLSVVIRTLCMEAGRFEFQVGGGIVADSEPESEWQETITKAKGLCRAMGLDIAMVERL